MEDSILLKYEEGKRMRKRVRRGDGRRKNDIAYVNICFNHECLHKLAINKLFRKPKTSFSLILHLYFMVLHLHPSAYQIGLLAYQKIREIQTNLTMIYVHIQNPCLSPSFRISLHLTDWFQAFNNKHVTNELLISA